jgi:hypothetical protein
MVQISSANSKALIAGFALVVTGGLISMCGIGISGTAMVNAIRRWVMAQQEPPSAIVRRKISQVKAATAAGAKSWQDGMATTSRAQ